LLGPFFSYVGPRNLQPHSPAPARPSDRWARCVIDCPPSRLSRPLLCGSRSPDVPSTTRAHQATVRGPRPNGSSSPERLHANTAGSAQQTGYSALSWPTPIADSGPSYKFLAAAHPCRIPSLILEGGPPSVAMGEDVELHHHAQRKESEAAIVVAAGHHRLATEKAPNAAVEHYARGALLDPRDIFFLANHRREHRGVCRWRVSCMRRRGWGASRHQSR
jgi:hypothetical protein